MSVLIKDMEKPTKCEDCPMCEIAYCIRLRRFINNRNDIEEDCPIFEFPPHGRIIDADEFLNRAIGTKCFRGDYALMLVELVGESTTIIPAEGKEENNNNEQ